MKKGMSTTLVIVVAAVVILITALMVILVLTGGIENFLNIFNPWSQNTAINALCQTQCQSDCINSGGNLAPNHVVKIQYDKNGDGVAEDVPCSGDPYNLKCSCA